MPSRNPNTDTGNSRYTDLEEQKVGTAVTNKPVTPDMKPVKKPERLVILDEATNHVTNTRHFMHYQTKKAKYFYCCFFSNFIGITLTLWSLSLTVLFEKYSKSTTLLYISLVFYLPFVVWLRVMFFPGKSERNHRRKIYAATAFRKRVEFQTKNFINGRTDEVEEERILREEKAAKKAAERKNSKMFVTRISFSDPTSKPSLRQSSTEDVTVQRGSSLKETKSVKFGAGTTTSINGEGSSLHAGANVNGNATSTTIQPKRSTSKKALTWEETQKSLAPTMPPLPSYAPPVHNYSEKSPAIPGTGIPSGKLAPINKDPAVNFKKKAEWATDKTNGNGSVGSAYKRESYKRLAPTASSKSVQRMGDLKLKSLKATPSMKS